MAKGLHQLCVFFLKHKQIQSAEGGELESKFCFDNKKWQQTLFWQRVGTQQRSSDSEQRQESPCYTSQLNFSESQAQRVKRALPFFLFFFYTRLLEGTETVCQLAAQVPTSNNRGSRQNRESWRTTAEPCGVRPGGKPASALHSSSLKKKKISKGRAEHWGTSSNVPWVRRQLLQRSVPPTRTSAG